MLLSYHDCEIKYGSYYQIKKALDARELYKIEPGIYADTPDVSELETISFILLPRTDRCDSGAISPRHIERRS